MIDMLCCLGLFAGFYLGSVFGGPWTYLGPLIGFGVGMAVDTKLMRGQSCHAGNSKNSVNPSDKTKAIDGHSQDDQKNNPEVSMR